MTEQNTEEKDMAEIVLSRTGDAPDQRHMEQRTQEALHVLLDMAEILVQVSNKAEGSGEQDGTSATREVAQRLLELLRKMLGCSRASVVTVDPDTEELSLMAEAGSLSEQAEQGQQWQEGEQALLSDCLADPHLLARLKAKEILMLDATPAAVGRERPFLEEVHRIFATPMFLADQLLGILSIDYGNCIHICNPDEQTLLRAVARLLILVMERDRLLQERELARANELALREANRRMDEFLGMASHELRSPLTSIKANIQLAERRIRLYLQEDTYNEGFASKLMVAQELLNRADSQVGMLNRVVNDLLDISRIRANRLELQLNPSPFDLISLVQNIVREQREIYPERAILLNLPPERHIYVVIDANRIGQVLINYLTNAIKYAPANRPIEVSVSQERENALVSVRDEGPGLSQAERERIWERFYRSREVKTLNGSNVSLGLGLHICKTIVDLHHGAVGVHSTPGKGSSFWFTLPLLHLE
jgi:signal transduction histidine kinase